MKCIVLAALLAVAAAQQHHEHHANSHAIHEQLLHVFQHMDANGDGGVTIGEDLAYFDKGDTNGDGKLSYQEFHANRQQAHGPIHATEEQIRMAFNFYDTLGGTQSADGFILRDDSNYFFPMVDINGDGHFTEQEFETTAAKLAQAMATGATMQPPATTMQPTAAP